MSDGLYLFHGILMGAAWFFFAPLAIGISLVRRFTPKDSLLNQNGLWYKIHLYSAIAAVLFTVVGFLIVIIGDGGDDGRRMVEESLDEDDSSEGGSEDGGIIAFGLSEDDADELHKNLGIAIFALAMFQALLGFIRPNIVPKTTPSNPDFGGVHKPTSNLEMTSRQSEEGSETGPQEYHYGVSQQQVAAAADPSNAAAVHPPKSTSRLVWELGHRLLGAGILISAWINCAIGIKLDD